jgi:asparagine synthase (glutamine-hydrolysing)
MCGIAGIIGDPVGLDPPALLKALEHRGPDRQAAVTPSEGVWLAAARLAISDPSPAGNQPMTTPDGALTIVYNGEIYNAAELRKRLTDRGHAFRSRCDTEVVLYAYREWGDALVDRLEGMFAFGLWDAPRRRLVLARDPLGVKPLWLQRSRERVVFASEVRALLAARAVPASIAPAAVRSFLHTGSVAEPAALVRGVEALQPGTLATLAGGTESRSRYFVLPRIEESPPPEEAAARVRARLAESVRGCLEADVRVALLLSGGIDSAALALVAGAGRPITTFHVCVGDAVAERAARLSASLGFRHEEVRLDGAQVLEALPQLLAAQDQPSVDGANSFFIARAVHQAGLKAAVTGLGADELFLGYPLHRSYVQTRRIQARLNGISRPLAGAARLAGWLKAATPHGPWQIDKLLGVAQATLESPRATYAALRALFPAASVARLQADPPDGRSASDHVRGSGELGLSPAGEVSRFELANYLVDTLLRDADVMGMAHGVELRVPLLERRLVETVVPLAGALKLRPGAQKPLLVDAVPELPPELAHARKEGFELPVERWLGESLRDPVAAALLDRDASLRVGLSPKAVAAVWRRFVERRDRPSAFRAWALYSLLEWARTHRASL